MYLVCEKNDSECPVLLHGPDVFTRAHALASPRIHVLMSGGRDYDLVYVKNSEYRPDFIRNRWRDEGCYPDYDVYSSDEKDGLYLDFFRIFRRVYIRSANEYSVALARLMISVPEKPVPDAGTLFRLHRSHVLAVPYENTDYLSGNIKSSAFETQFREVILGRRGGMCIDLNPLFGQLLTSLGYKVSYYSTGICQQSPDDLNFHVILNVEDCDGQIWWCDIANPFTRFYDPLPVITDRELPASGSLFRFGTEASAKYVLYESVSGVWKELLAVKDTDVTAEDRDESKFHAVRDYPHNALCPEGAVFNRYSKRQKNAHRQSLPRIIRRKAVCVCVLRRADALGIFSIRTEQGTLNVRKRRWIRKD